jgi:hypothetical protein
MCWRITTKRRKMKLVACRDCQDIFKLSYEQRSCKCGNTWGYYKEDGLHAVYGGASAVPLGIANESLRAAVIAQPLYGWGKRFEAFVIPKNCETMVREEG